MSEHGTGKQRKRRWMHGVRWPFPPCLGDTATVTWPSCPGASPFRSYPGYLSNLEDKVLDPPTTEYNQPPVATHGTSRTEKYPPQARYKEAGTARVVAYHSTPPALSHDPSSNCLGQSTARERVLLALGGADAPCLTAEVLVRSAALRSIKKTQRPFLTLHLPCTKCSFCLLQQLVYQEDSPLRV